MDRPPGYELLQGFERELPTGIHVILIADAILVQLGRIDSIDAVVMEPIVSVSASSARTAAHARTKKVRINRKRMTGVSQTISRPQ
jgi:hypothetical protein